MRLSFFILLIMIVVPFVYAAESNVVEMAYLLDSEGNRLEFTKYNDGTIGIPHAAGVLKGADKPAGEDLIYNKRYADTEAGVEQMMNDLKAQDSGAAAYVETKEFIYDRESDRLSFRDKILIKSKQAINGAKTKVNDLLSKDEKPQDTEPQKETDENSGVVFHKIESEPEQETTTQVQEKPAEPAGQTWEAFYEEVAKGMIEGDYSKELTKLQQQGDTEQYYNLQMTPEAREEIRNAMERIGATKSQMDRVDKDLKKYDTKLYGFNVGEPNDYLAQTSSGCAASV